MFYKFPLQNLVSDDKKKRRIGQIAWYFHYTKCQWVKLRGDLNENTIEYFQQFAHICIAVPSIVELCWGATP